MRNGNNLIVESGLDLLNAQVQYTGNKACIFANRIMANLMTCILYLLYPFGLKKQVYIRT